MGTTSWWLVDRPLDRLVVVVSVGDIGAFRTSRDLAEWCERNAGGAIPEGRAIEVVALVAEVERLRALVARLATQLAASAVQMEDEARAVFAEIEITSTVKRLKETE